MMRPPNPLVDAVNEVVSAADSQVSFPVPDSNAAADDKNDSGVRKRHKSDIDASIERIHENKATEASKDPHAGKVSEDISAPVGAKANGIPTMNHSLFL
jgi:hypothetical protein